MHMYNFLCSDSLLYTSFFFFLLYIVFIHVIVHGKDKLSSLLTECYPGAYAGGFLRFPETPSVIACYNYNYNGRDIFVNYLYSPYTL